jgi:eukaryotic-like serine/threonine-protein kinase
VIVMPVESAADLLDALRLGKLLEPAQLEELTGGLLAHFPDSRSLAAHLIRRGWLTPYQANQLLQGRGAGLLLGSYVLMDRLGEGGMGQVFKARNWKLGRVVALKLIRKERLGNPDAVRRFHREIRAAAQLDHPHVVHAYDADEAGGAHFFVMELVEGTDLGRLVKKEGPLPIDLACAYARQAALGLQHAFERGLVHRDVKPQNLLLTPQGVVKVLDLGLARLSQGGEDGEGSSTMTQEGAVMGTPDYMAPEQTLDSHAVDIRADLYSLGCTLYFLLTGKVPFPGGSLGEKIARHQMREPEPVERRRPETPAAAAAVVRKLMAKRPEDRYQTPAEAAAALGTVAATSAGAMMPAEELARASTFTDLAEQTAAQGDGTAPREADERRRRRTAARRRRIAAYATGGVLSLGLLGLFVLLALRVGLPTATPPVTASPKDNPGPASPPEVRAVAFEQWLKNTRSLPADQQVKAVVAELKQCNPGFDGLATPAFENGVVVGLTFSSAEVADLSPLRALPGLAHLHCLGNGPALSKLNDLSPLKGLPLTTLDCVGTAVRDLSPLRDMPLTYLECNGTNVADLTPLHGTKLEHLGISDTRVTDLSPLKGVPLTYLHVNRTAVKDLSPLAGMQLVGLEIDATAVTDLSPLRGMPLTFFACRSTPVTDLTPLQKAPLQRLLCDFDPKRDGAILRSIPMLQTINDKPAAEVLKDAGDVPLPRP